MDEEKAALKGRKKIVISGGGSFIARHFLKKLDICKYEITVLVRNIPEAREQLTGVKYLALDMEQYHELDKYINTCDFYLAFAWNGTKREDRDNEEINQKSYQCILNSIETLVKKCKCSKVLILGTFSEYKNTYVLIDETTCCGPELAYGKYKCKLYNEAGRLCKEYGVSFIEARLFSVYGPDDREDGMIYKVLEKMKSNEDVYLTKAEQIWDYIHVDDVTEALLRLMENNIDDGCYNIATMEHRTLKSYLEEMKIIIGSESKLVYGAIPYQGEQIPHVICDTRKIFNTIKWKPLISFEEGIKELIWSKGR